MVLTRRASYPEPAMGADEPPQKLAKTSDEMELATPLLSPNCVVTANAFLPAQDALSLGEPASKPATSKGAKGRLSARHGTPKEGRMPHACWWRQLQSLSGTELIERLRTISIDEMIDYHGGVLNARFVELIIELYDHVCQQGDAADGGIYGEASPIDNSCLPKWYPGDDGAGFSRIERLKMAVEYDAFQWYMISSENYSMLDTLVWMGVHLQKLFSRPGTPCPPPPPAANPTIGGA
eukprot:CAMPEP_0180273682 /NCGR_PEP_ID=MMETSP0988-20121125/4928_1 /TAXON_ID=697907 /ORGANISM="non described non described, Strain CCMP2293" /LENGTH=236 /DNA_ID=CAMNT_0022244875 /DNA_START=174 /DNA_END=884 /DNA_ORIENTATION=+